MDSCTSSTVEQRRKLLWRAFISSRGKLTWEVALFSWLHAMAKATARHKREYESRQRAGT